MSIGTIILIILVIALLGGFSGIGGGPFYGTGYYGGGGLGANFVVDWASAGEIAEPVIETLMFGSVGNRHFSFVSQGRATKIVGGK